VDNWWTKLTEMARFGRFKQKPRNDRKGLLIRRKTRNKGGVG